MGRTGKIRIHDLKPGQELICWFRTGHAPKPVRLPRGEVVVLTPPSAENFKNGSLSRCKALVMENIPETGCIRLRVVPANNRMYIPSGDSYDGYFHYSHFTRVRLISPIAFPHKPDWPRKTPLGEGHRNYHTVVEVSLV